MPKFPAMLRPRQRRTLDGGRTGSVFSTQRRCHPGGGAPAPPTISPLHIGDTAGADLVRRSPETRHEPALTPPSTGTAALAGRYAAWGAVAGAAVGFTYGLTQGDDALGLSPGIEAAIGMGVGFYLGLAVDLVRSLRQAASPILCAVDMKPVAAHVASVSDHTPAVVSDLRDYDIAGDLKRRSHHRRPGYFREPGRFGHARPRHLAPPAAYPDFVFRKPGRTNLQSFDTLFVG